MGLETGTNISDLVSTNPTAGDSKSQGDDHIRLIKAVLKATFANFTGALTATHTFLNNLYAGQLAFPAAQNASADPNTLDDYEEGTFTPALSFGGASVGITYTQQEGKYTKVGNRVDYRLNITLSNKGSSTGGLSIGGLPFTCDTGGASAGGLWIHSTSATSGQVMPILSANTTAITLWMLNTGTATQLTDANATNTTVVRIQGAYFV